MTCVVGQEASLGGWARAGEEWVERAKNITSIHQRQSGILACKGSRATAHRKQLAQAMLEAVRGIPANQGANVVLLEESAIPLNDLVAARRGRSEIYGWIFRLAGDRPLQPPADGELTVGWGYGPKVELGRNTLSLFPLPGKRGAVDISWAGWVPRRGQLMTKQDAAALAGSRLPRSRGSRGAGTTRAGPKASEHAKALAKARVPPELQDDFERVVAGYEERGAPCFDAASREVRLGVPGKCGPGSKCAGSGRFVPCSTPNASAPAHEPAQAEAEQQAAPAAAAASSEPWRAPGRKQRRKQAGLAAERTAEEAARCQQLARVGTEAGLAAAIAASDNQARQAKIAGKQKAAVEEESREGEQETALEVAFHAEMLGDIRQTAAVRHGQTMSPDLVEVEAQELMRQALKMGEEQKLSPRALAVCWRREKERTLAQFARPFGGYVGGVPAGQGLRSPVSSGTASPAHVKQKRY